jgi:tetratricopeptide (TPR) repeat protein
MKARLIVAMLVVLLSTAAMAQNATVKGKATDENGQPIADAQVIMKNLEIGRTVTLKTDKGGNFFSIAVPSGKYHISLQKDGKELWHFSGFPITLSVPENIVDFDLKKERSAAAAGGKQPQLTEEQKKQLAEIEKENVTIKQLNQMLADAKAARDAGDFAKAEGVLQQAVQTDPNRELLWFNLAETQAGGAKQETDRTARKAKYEQAGASYKKAVDLALVSTDQRMKPLVGDFYNNYAKALEGAGQVDQAVAAYEEAAKHAPQNSGMYYFNQGAILTNANRSDEAVRAFDKAIAADPAKADAYYWKGIAYMGKATTKDGKYVAPEGTEEAFQKYLELQPDGPLAQPAKDMLAALGSEVKTSLRPRSKKKSDKN